MTLSLVPGPGLWQGTQVVQVDLTNDPAGSFAVVSFPVPTLGPNSGLVNPPNGQLYAWTLNPWTNLYSGPATSYNLPAGQIYRVIGTIQDAYKGLGVFNTVLDNGNGSYNLSNWSCSVGNFPANGMVAISLNSGRNY